MVDIANVVRKISVAETVKNLSVGETKVIRQKDIDGNVVRATISRLSKKGYTFFCKSHTEGVMVTRLK